MNITIVAGARPNFMKVSPIIKEIKKRSEQGLDIQYQLVHTGQHYDKSMSGSFFDDLKIPHPTVNLNAGGGTQAEQTATIMIGFESYLSKEPCDLVIVVGDVTSTLACSIVAKKAGIKVAHVEGGIRSGDLSMPEEINRMVTDSISDYFFTTSRLAGENLLRLGASEESICFVGNTMIDTLISNLENLRKPGFFDKLGLQNGVYFVMTMHRPANVDQEHYLIQTLKEISENTGAYPVVFPVHPRTKKIIDSISLNEEIIKCVSPLGYLEFNYLVKNSKGVITDSGGITEETTYLGIPCLTLRDNTERPETIKVGTNELVGTDPYAIAPHMRKLLNGEWKEGKIPELWDGRAAERILDFIIEEFLDSAVVVQG